MSKFYSCICCNIQYQNTGYNFYTLCNDCFNEFDNQKMNGRFSFGTIPYHENVRDFIASQNCTHNNKHNMINSFYNRLYSEIKPELTTQKD